MTGTLITRIPGTFVGGNSGLLPTYTPPDGLTIGSWMAAFWAEDPDWTPPSSGGNITSWRDGSGNARDASQVGSLGVPTYSAADADLGGKPSAQFSGSQVLLADVPDSNWPYSIVTIARVAATGGSGHYAVGTNPGNAGQGVGVNSTPAWVANFATSLAGGTPDTSAHLISVVNANTASVVQVDGTTVAGPGSAGATSLQQVAIGGGLINATPSISNGWKGSIAFVGVLAGDVTTQPWWAAFKAWAAAHYGLTVA